MTGCFMGCFLGGGRGFGGAGGGIAATVVAGFGLGAESRATSITLMGFCSGTVSLGCNNQTITVKCSNSTKIVSKLSKERGETSRFNK